MEHTFKELSMEKMSMSQLEQFKKSIDKEIASRKAKEREEARKEVYKLLSNMRDICYNYDIELYDEYGSIVNLDELTI